MGGLKSTFVSGESCENNNIESLALDSARSCWSAREIMTATTSEEATAEEEVMIQQLLAGVVDRPTGVASVSNRCRRRPRRARATPETGWSWTLLTTGPMAGRSV